VAAPVTLHEIVNGEFVEVWRECADRFHQENPGIVMSIEPTPWDEMHRQVMLRIMAADPFDTTYMYDYWYGEFQNMGALLDLTDRVAAWPDRTKHLQAAWDQVLSLDGRAYGIPFAAVTKAIIYRPDWFEEAGVGIPTNRDEFLDTAIKLTDRSKERYGFAMRGGYGGERYWQMFMIQNTGGKWFDEDGVCLLNSSEAVAGLDWYADLYRVHKVCQPSAVTDGYQEMAGIFSAGSAGMYIHNAGSLYLQFDALGDDKVGTFPIPAGPLGKYVLVYFGMYTIAKGSKHPDEAFEWVKYATSDLQLISMFGDLPTYGPSINAPMYVDHPQFKTYFDQLGRTDELFQRPFWLPEWAGICETDAVPLYQSILLGEMSSQEAMNILAPKITEAQQKYLASLPPA
jgi:multiple sugar transport system substrate-binding protein